MINLRGAAVPVADLSVRFGKPASEVTKRTCIVILEITTVNGSRDIGLVVDTVNAVLDISPVDIEAAPAFGARIRTDFIQGMAKVDGKIIILLDVNHILDFDEMARSVAGSPEAGANCSGTSGEVHG